MSILLQTIPSPQNCLEVLSMWKEQFTCKYADRYFIFSMKKLKLFNSSGNAFSYYQWNYSQDNEHLWSDSRYTSCVLPAGLSLLHPMRMTSSFFGFWQSSFLVFLPSNTSYYKHLQHDLLFQHFILYTSPDYLIHCSIITYTLINIWFLYHEEYTILGNNSLYIRINLWGWQFHKRTWSSI